MTDLKYCESGTPIEQGTYDWNLMRMFEDFVATAPLEIRNDIYKSLKVTSDRYDGYFENVDYCDYSHSVSVGDKYDGWGDNILYVWIDRDGTPFYVGQAKCYSKRPRDVKYKTRSEEFKQVVRGGGCHVAVVARNIPDSKINDLEKELISYMCWKENKIVNKRDLPSTKECQMAREIADYSNKNLEEVFLERTKYFEEMRAIFTALKNILCADWDGICVEPSHVI